MIDHLSRLLATIGTDVGGPAPVQVDTDPGPFALLRRADADQVEVLVGSAHQVDRLADIPLEPGATPGPATLAVVPYRQLAERGFAHVDDGVPMECIQVSSCQRVPVRDVVAALPDTPVVTTGGGFDIDDDAYADLVARVLRDEIGHGAGANFVLHRTYRATLAGPGRTAMQAGPGRTATQAETGRSAAIAAGFSAFRRLLVDERGAYWTFLVYTGGRVLVGATPERHVSVSDGLAMMNPISGTLRHPCGEPDVATLLAFLDDPKEVEELYMVLDEELKMMATVAEHGGQVIGPYLKRMSRLSHTEYLLAGRSCHDVREVLRQTMFAPTVTGSPIENACRVIARYTPGGRRYYAGVLALLGHDDTGAQTVDAPILIRAAEITMDGELRVPVGATLVRHSTPAGEVAETHAKASAVLASLGLRSGPGVGPTTTGHVTDPAASAADPDLSAAGPDLSAAGPASNADPADVATEPAGDVGGTDACPATGVLATLARPEHPDVVRALAARNARLAGFWLDQRAAGALVDPRLHDRDVLVVDAEDSFTGMLAHLLRALGLRVRVAAWDRVDAAALVAAQVLVAGPGPGDPRDPAQPRMAALRDVVDGALGRRQPLLGVCLGHQVLADRLGLPVTRRTSPYQGLQREIDFFGVGRRVGFYSSYTATATADRLVTGHGPVRLCRDATDGAVHALVGPGFAGVQFHPESVLSPDGLAVLRDLLVALLPTTLPAR